jgi:hypothetical protein
MFRTEYRRVSCVFLFIVHLTVFQASVRAWGTTGHRIVARLAQRQLSPHARQEVRQLLRQGETLESVSTWADVIRNSRPETKRWHYVDILLEHDTYDPARDCKRTPFGDCIINALDEARGILADPARLETFKLVLANPQESRQARYEALKFLVHFIGDLHQPLHCADNHDQGGNGLKVTFFGAATNLHKVWDSDIIARAGFNQTVNRAAALPRTHETVTLAGDSFADWALEAHRLAVEHAYKNIPTNKRLGQSYYQSNRPVVDAQLQKAGLRLARVLNEIFHQ